MRGGDLGLGSSIGMGLGEARQNYASDVAIVFDELRSVYTGEMVSRGGVYRVEGPNSTSVYNQIENLLYNEYNEMMLEMTRKKKREFGSGLGDNVDIVTKETEDGRPIIILKDREEKNGLSLHGTVKAATFSAMVWSFVQGDLFGAALGACGLMIEDFFGRSSKRKKIFSVMFGGILITATSRIALKKLLTLHKNKRIQRIMNHIREDAKGESDRASENLSWHLTKNIRKKRLLAKASWHECVSKQGGGWRERLQDRELLCERIKNKREKAQALWTERAI